MPVQLPTEVCFHIIQKSFRDADLLSLSLSCTLFRHEAQRVLFSKPEFKVLQQEIQFIHSINSAPTRLGPYVRRFCIIDAGYYSTVDTSEVAIASALRVMTNLRRLKICRYVSMTILRGCTFSLSSFFDTTTYLQPSDISFLVSEFLPSQSDLKRLGLPGPDYTVAEPAPTAIICPKLDLLYVGSISLAKLFVPRSDRPIRRLHWWNKETMPELTVGQLNSLQNFLFRIRNQNADTSFTQHLTSLYLLELVVKMKTVDQVIRQVRYMF